MTRHLNWIGAVALALAALAIPAPAPAQDPATEALIIVYGPFARSREGDADRFERFYMSVPADTQGPLYLRVFDPDYGGANDSIFGRANSTTTFRFFGGDGAYTQAPRATEVTDGAPALPYSPRDAVPAPGLMLDERTFGLGRVEEVWETFLGFDPAQGEKVGDRLWFRLDAQGTAGDDGNVFLATLSRTETANVPPEGLEIVAYSPTLRWPGSGDPVEVRFAVPGDGVLSVQSFDAAFGRMAIVTDYEDLDVRPSGQDDWSVTRLSVPDPEAAFVLDGGVEKPNDITLSIHGSDGAALPLRMPPTRASLVSRPIPVATAQPLSNCTSVGFDASASHGADELRYRWDFGDGASSAEPVIAHTYTTPGRYEALLSILDPLSPVPRGARLRVPVHVRPAPMAVPGAPVTVAPGDAVAFSGTGSKASDSPITRWIWSFGDGATAMGAETAHAYEEPGLYRAVLRVEDNSGHPCDFGLATRAVMVNFAPVPEAGTDQMSAVGDTLTFDGGSSYDKDGTITAWRWDMGDGTVLEGPQVSHSYTASGTYRVVLTVTDDSGVSNDTASDALGVIVNAPPAPVATGPSRPVAVAEVATISAAGSTDPDGVILEYMWDFGDGAMADGPEVQYAWAAPGVYPVTLTVTDDSATPSARSSATIEVIVSAAPVAEAGPDQFVTASVVRFDGGGSSDPDGSISSWFWDFGDGTQGSGREVAHAYRSPGLYEVTLVVRDDSGAPLNQDRDKLLVVVNAAPLADAGPDIIVAPGQSFVLDAAGSIDPDGNIAAYLWTWPDGTGSQGERVEGRFEAPGLYRVALAVRDDFQGGAAAARDEVVVVVNAAPVAVIGPDLLVEPGMPVRFSAIDSHDPDGEIAQYIWDFDDLDAPVQGMEVERIFKRGGTVSVQLTVIDGSGALNATDRASITVHVNHAPQAEAGPDISTDVLQVSFDASGSSDADGDALIHVWNFGDGSPARIGRKISHTFPASGRYPVTLRVDDGTGRGNSADSDALVVFIDAAPLALAGGNRDVCSGDSILFDASKSRDPDGGRLRYTWDFGDGTASDLVNPTKIYEAPGTYPVTLTVRDESGSPRGVDIDRIAALVREGPIADAGPDLRACTNRSVRFDGSNSSDADGAVNAFNWLFGDGAEGSGDQPVHTYREAGTYTVTLQITGDAIGQCNPQDTDTMVVEVASAPSLRMQTDERLPEGTAGQFTAVIDNAGTAVAGSIRWDFGDGTTAEGLQVDKAFDAPGVYLVTASTELTGATEGCGDLTTQRRIIVNDAPEPVLAGPLEIAAGDSVVFDGLGSVDPDGVLTGFYWDFGDGAGAEGAQVSHVFREAGSYKVSLAVTDDAGVANSTVTSEMTVAVTPAPLAGLADPGAICAGEPVDWSTGLGPEVAARWSFGDGTQAEGPQVSHAFAEPGLYPVSLWLDDGRGLPNSRRTEEVPVRVNRPPRAFAGPDRVVCPGQDIRFNAGRSGDRDGTLSSWRWEFSDGVVLDGPRARRSFEAPGTYEVRLVVTDDSGAQACASAEDTALIRVNAAPDVGAGPEQSTFVGAAHDVLDFTASASDPDGDGVRLEWSFGDGATASGAEVSHRFTQPGRYEVSVTATDATGLSCGIASDTTVVTATARD